MPITKNTYYVYALSQDSDPNLRAKLERAIASMEKTQIANTTAFKDKGLVSWNLVKYPVRKLGTQQAIAFCIAEYTHGTAFLKSMNRNSRGKIFKTPEAAIGEAAKQIEGWKEKLTKRSTPKR